MKQSTARIALVVLVLGAALGDCAEPAGARIDGSERAGARRKLRILPGRTQSKPSATSCLRVKEIDVKEDDHVSVGQQLFSVGNTVMNLDMKPLYLTPNGNSMNYD
jgi:multidrug efflux pump subunit AcrA (membrane-fusion protein)